MACARYEALLTLESKLLMARAFPLFNALQTLLAKNQPEKGSNDFQPEKNR
jgi:hypothetical protein